MLDESTTRFLDELAAAGLPPIHELSPEQARAAGERHGRAATARGPRWRAPKRSSSARPMTV